MTMDVAEVGQRLGVSTKTVYRLIQRGYLKTLPGIRHKLICRDSFDNYLHGNLS